MVLKATEAVVLTAVISAVIESTYQHWNRSVDRRMLFGQVSLIPVAQLLVIYCICGVHQ